MTETNINSNDFLEKAKNAKTQQDIIDIIEMMSEALLNSIENSKKDEKKEVLPLKEKENSENKNISNQNQNINNIILNNPTFENNINNSNLNIHNLGNFSNNLNNSNTYNNLEKVEKNNKININISEVDKIIEKEAERYAKEKYLEEQKKSNFFKKFFTELFLKNKKIENFKKIYEIFREKNIFDEKFAYSVSRLNTENDLDSHYQTIIDLLKNKGGFKIIINLSNEYINGNINKEKFEEEFKKILEIIDFKGKAGTDLFLKLDKYKNYKNFLKSLKFSFSKELEIKNFLKNFENRQILESQLGFKINEKSLDYTINFLSDINNLENLLNENFEIKIFFPKLKNTALEVDYSKNKENNFFYKTGKFLEKNPILSTFGTSLGLIGSSMIPLFGKIFGATGLGFLSGSKKSKQYIDNHKEAVERISFSEKNEFEENFKKIDPENLNFFQKFLYNLNLKKLKLYKKNGSKKNGNKENLTKEDGSKEDGSKEDGSKEDGSKEDGSKEDGTVHRHFLDINFLKRKINFYLDKIEDLTEKEKEYLLFWLVQAKARIDLGSEEKTSFLKSSNFENSEKEFAELIFTMENGFKKLGNIFEDYKYKIFFNETLAKNKGLLRKDLSIANKGFNETLRKEILKNFGSTFSIYILSSFILGKLINKFNITEEIITEKISTTQVVNKPQTIEEININTHIYEKLSKITGFTEISQLENFLNNNKNISFWEKIIQSSSNEIEGNKMKNQLLEIILEAKDNQGKSKLFLEAQNSGILEDFSNNGEHSQKIMKKLVKWGYNSVNKEEILAQLKGLNDGSLKIEELKPNQKIILSEIMFDYLDKENYWEQLKNVFFDKIMFSDSIKVSEILETENIKTITKEKFNLDFLKEIGIPVHLNRYFSRKTKKEDKQE